MKFLHSLVIFAGCLLSLNPGLYGQQREKNAPVSSIADPDWKKYSGLLKKTIYKEYPGMFREAGGALLYPFLTPGSSQYGDVLWDWDSWLSDVALRQTLLEAASEKDKANALKYEQGCVLNYLSFSGVDGWVPIVVGRGDTAGKNKPVYIYETNMHKPCLAQHAAFLTKLNGGDAGWLRNDFYHLQTFVDNYVNHERDAATGLYFWPADNAIGVDNDPCTFYRPARSSGSIYLNCMMYKELKAMAYLCSQLHLTEIAPQFEKNAADLKEAIQKNCWDEKDGFFYSVDLNLLPLKNDRGFVLHGGMPRDWNCLIQRIGVWSGFMAMWAGIATGNPSSWLGPVWGVSNYLTWRGLVEYGHEKEALQLAAKTVELFGRDLEKYGTLHEYYQPENGEPILNPGFQNWNYLVLNMLAWLEKREVIHEF